jgi:nitric oxide reductase NorD protein
MGLDEAFFGKFYKAWKNKFKPDPIDPPHTVYLKEITLRLEILASALIGQKVDIYPTRLLGGFIGNDLYLPEKIFLSSDPQINLKAYLCHVIFSSETKNEAQIISEISTEQIYPFVKKIILKYL